MTKRHIIALLLASAGVLAASQNAVQAATSATTAASAPATSTPATAATAMAATATAAPATAAPATAALQPGTAERGREKVQMCQGCHGVPGFRTAFPEVYSVPRLAGQHPEYIVKALQEYKSGERTHPSMNGIAAALSDQDMADVAAYYAQVPVTTAGK